MRIRLRKGKQHELVEKAKKKWNFTWAALAKVLEVSEGYLRNELQNEIRTLSPPVFEKLCKLVDEDYCTFIEETLPPNWGQIKGGLMAPPPRPKEPKILAPPSEDLAEVIGLMLGDGNSYVSPKWGVCAVRVCGHLHLDREYLLEFVPSIFERVFGIALNHYEFEERNEIFAYKLSKDLVHTLAFYGFPPGNKKKNNVGIPTWIMCDQSFLRVCIRGLIDTDGSVYPRTDAHPVPSIWFKSAIPNLREDFRCALQQLDFNPTKWTKATSGFSRGSDVMQCSLARAEEVMRYYQEIGFNNPKHDRRFHNFIGATV
jgi:hypothetical protein